MAIELIDALANYYDIPKLFMDVCIFVCMYKHKLSISHISHTFEIFLLNQGFFPLHEYVITPLQFLVYFGPRMSQP